ncbi:MAG: phosphatase PAP2 family protein, partial [Anaerolineales bacterium]
TETTFGIPSGHAQNSIVVWGSMAASIGKRWVWAAAIVLSLLIGLSRIYLGVHFTIDVLAGWLVGALLLWTLLKLEPWVLEWLENKNLSYQIAAAFTVSVLLIVLAAIVRMGLNGWEIPPRWIENARAANPESGLSVGGM